MYMTSERPLHPRIVFIDEIKGLRELSDIEVIDEHSIKPETVILSHKSKFKNLIRNLLDIMSLTHYGSEGADEYKIAIKESPKRIVFRLYTIGDHIYCVNVRFLNFELHDQDIIFEKLNRMFKNIEIYTF